MAAQYTKNLQLIKPSYEDLADIMQINENMDKLDAASVKATTAADNANQAADRANEAAQSVDTAKQQATDAAVRANAAADKANTSATAADAAAGKANDSAANADTAASVANTAAAAANQAAQTATEAADYLLDMDAEAKGLAAGAKPTATVTDVDGHAHITFGLPQGEPGTPGKDGKDGAPGAPGKDGTNGLNGTEVRVYDSGESKTQAQLETMAKGSFTVTVPAANLATVNGAALIRYTNTDRTCDAYIVGVITNITSASSNKTLTVTGSGLLQSGPQGEPGKSGDSVFQMVTIDSTDKQSLNTTKGNVIYNVVGGVFDDTSIFPVAKNDYVVLQVGSDNDSYQILANVGKLYARQNDNPATGNFSGKFVEIGRIPLSNATPKDLGPSASPGTSNDVSRSDHVHKLPQIGGENILIGSKPGSSTWILNTTATNNVPGFQVNVIPSGICHSGVCFEYVIPKTEVKYLGVGTRHGEDFAIDGTELPLGTPITISCWVKASEADVTAIIGIIGGVNEAIVETTVTTEWQKYSRTYTANGTALSYAYLYIHGSSVDQSVYIGDVKVEIGEVPTDWSPAVEEKLYKTDPIGGTNLLRGTGAFNFVDNKNQNYDAYDSFSWVFPSGGSGNVSVTSLDFLGNKNVSAFEITATSGNVDAGQRYIPVEEGKEYTLSFYAKALTSGVSLLIRSYGYKKVGSMEGQTEYFRKTYVIQSDSWNKYTETFTVPASYPFIIVAIGLDGSKVPGTIQVCRPKLEKGVVPTDWSPAPEDLQRHADTATTLSATLPLEKGGTGATDLAGAKKALGVPTFTYQDGTLTITT